MTDKINGIDVSECKYLNKVVNEEPYCNIDEEHLYTCSSDENCYFKQLKRLQEENEKIKKQYNCYACGNCNGREDYINLEKHHKGLRKQFDELAKRNNTLSFRIEELEKENEELKSEHSKLIHRYNNLYEKYRAKEILEPQLKDEIKRLDMLSIKYYFALEEIREILMKSMSLKSNAYNHFINVEKAIDKISEVLNEN